MMKNYDKGITDKMLTESQKLYNAFDESAGWASDYLKYEEQKSLSKKVKIGRAEIRKINSTIESKPVFALFGVSQVGKSYLVKNLLSVKGGPLNIACGGKNLDFLSTINPQGGGAESTGVVTRFSADNVGLSDEFPVRAKLLSVRDILIILSDSFFSDITRMQTYLKEDEFRQHAISIQAEFGGNANLQSALTEDDIWDLREYFRQNFNKFSHFVEHIEKSDFWSIIGSCISKIPSDQWFKVFQPIWSSNEYLTEVFKLLAAELESLNFEKLAYLPTEAILRDEGAVLDVQQLQGVFNGTKELTISLASAEIKTVKIARLSAVIGELTLTIDPATAAEKPFLENTDLLDFPGARSRLELYFDDINTDSVVDMFLRGKIAYLFNKYSSDFEINNLLFCMKDEQIEVSELPSILHEWIVKNVGEDAEKRSGNIGNLSTSPLFVILTFFNNQLKYDSINDDELSHHWKNRFNRFFKDQITARFPWDQNWTVNEPNFSNFFMLRDYKFSDHTFDGFEENEVESAVRPDRVNHLARLEESFLNFPFVKEHFKDPKRTWDECASPNNDGSQRIIEELLPAANNHVKVKNYTTRLSKHKDSLAERLKGFHVSDNLQEKRDKAYQLGNDMQFGLLNLFKSPNFQFSDLLKTMSLKDTEVFNYIHDNFLLSSKPNGLDQYTIFRSMFPGISGENSKNANLEIIRQQLKKDSIEEVEHYLQAQEMNLDEALENKMATSATKLIDGIIELWYSKLTLESFEPYIQQGLTQGTFSNFTENLKTTFELYNVRDELVRLFEQKTKLVYSPLDTEEYLAAISTGYINDFVASFGYNFMQKDRLNELMELCTEYNMDLSSLRPNANNGIPIDSLIAVYDNENLDQSEQEDSPLVANFNLYLTKMKLALLSNCGFANYDVKANDELNTLINTLEEIDLSLD